MIVKSIQGEIATGSSRFVVGREQNEHIYYAVKTDNGVIDIIRRNLNGTIEWSADNGASWHDLAQTGAHGNTANISAHAQVDASADTPLDNSLLSGDTTSGTWKKMDYKDAFPTAKTPDSTPANDENKIILLGEDGKIDKGFENISDETYSKTTWNGDTSAPTKNAIRNKIESMPSLKSVAGTTLIAEANAVKNDDSGSWVKVKEIEIKVGGVYTTEFELHSIDSGEVPIIGTPAFSRETARFSGVCPPY